MSVPGLLAVICVICVICGSSRLAGAPIRRVAVSPFMMLLAEFALAIDYGQIFVFRPSPASPVVAWTDEHVAQGFAWSPSAVSFGVPYSLVFEALPGEVATDHDYPFVFKLTFCADPYPDFEILKQGAELTTNQVLRKDS